MHKQLLPLPSIYYIGSTVTADVTIEKEGYIKPFPVKEVSFKDNILHIQKGLDNKYLKVESSQDGKDFTTETDTLVSQKYVVKTSMPYYRITPINRHGILGDAVTIQIPKED